MLLEDFMDFFMAASAAVPSAGRRFHLAHRAQPVHGDRRNDLLLGDLQASAHNPYRAGVTTFLSA